MTRRTTKKEMWNQMSNKPCRRHRGHLHKCPPNLKPLPPKSTKCPPNLKPSFSKGPPNHGPSSHSNILLSPYLIFKIQTPFFCTNVTLIWKNFRQNQENAPPPNTIASIEQSSSPDNNCQTNSPFLSYVIQISKSYCQKLCILIVYTLT